MSSPFVTEFVNLSMSSSILRQSTTESSSILTNLTWFVNEFVNSSLNQSFGHWVRQFLTQFVNSSISSSIRQWVRQFVTEFVNSSMTSSILRQSTTESLSILTNLTWFVKFVNSSPNQSFGHWVRQFLTQFVNSLSISSAIRHWVRELVTEFVNSLKWLRQHFFNLVRQRDCQFAPYSIIWSLSSSTRHWVRHEFVNEFANTSSIHCTESSSILTNLTWFVDNFINPVYWFYQLIINLADSSTSTL